MSHRILIRVLASAGALLAAGFAGHAAAQSDRALDNRAAKALAEYWTADRKKAAIPRDLVIDERGLGYIRHSNGDLEPHGHDIAPMAGPPSGGDTTPPAVTTVSPAQGATVGATATFTVTATDNVGVKSVSMSLRKGSGLPQSFNMTLTGGEWKVGIQGLTDGTDWSWNATAKDGGKPANITTSPWVGFKVVTGSPPPPPPPPSDKVSSAPWATGIARATIGRIYFEMPSNPKKTRWSGYVCSGTVINDDPLNNVPTAAERSIILTASHCVYDDATKTFARNVLFIPDQMDTTGTATDHDCTNDPIGCWSPAFGVVDLNWTNKVFPDNVAWDYAFYVVNNTGAHTGNGGDANVVLDQVVGTTMKLSFANVNIGSSAYALGYSYSEDPKLMYCSDTLTNESASNNADYWLAGCGLTGGSSGGPWSQPFDTVAGGGLIISVNSWGYTGQPGMAGPKLYQTSASCVFNAAQTSGLTGGNVVKTCP